MANWAQWRETIFLMLPPAWQVALQNNFIQRCIAGTLLAIASLAAIWILPNLFPVYIWFFILVSVREWQRMTEPETWQQNVHYLYSIVILLAVVQQLFGTAAAMALLAVVPLLMWLIAVQIRVQNKLWFAASMLYLAPAAIAVVHMHEKYTIGAAVVTYFFAVVWATDTAAYLIGRNVGGALFAPDISPKKTWSGFVGGLVAGTLVGVLVGMLLDSQQFLMTLYVSGAISAAAQGSDLAQSAIKRVFSVKDTGGVIPGHGGVLDRIDSLMLSAPLYALLQIWAHRALPW